MNMKLFWREDGNPHGPPVLLAHAFPTSHAIWDWQIAALGKRYRLIRPDIRGFGQSPVPPPPYSMEDIAADLINLLDHLELDSVNFIGVSMGGMVGQVLTLNYPDRVRSLALCMTNSVVPADTPTGDDPAYSICARLMKAAAERAYKQGMSPIITMCMDRWFTETFQLSSQAKKISAIIGRNSPTGYHGGVEAMCGFDVTEQLHKIRQPTLVMPGALDKATPPRCSDVIVAHIPDSKLQVIDGVKHIGIVERPDPCNAHLLAHLDAFAN